MTIMTITRPKLGVFDWLKKILLVLVFGGFLCIFVGPMLAAQMDVSMLVAIVLALAILIVYFVPTSILKVVCILLFGYVVGTMVAGAQFGALMASDPIYKEKMAAAMADSFRARMAQEIRCKQ